MSVQEIIQKTKALGIVLYDKEGKLGFVAEAGTFPEDLKLKVRENKDQILAFLQSEAMANEPAPITPVPRQVLMPLSYSQQRLWFLDLFGGVNTAVYNMPTVLKVEGQFDRDVAERAFLTIIERHEVLRTVYEQSDESPMQRIRDKVDWQMAVHDLREFEGEQLDLEVKWLVTEDAHRPFDLAKDVMLRASWLEVSDEPSHGLLLFNMHHIASDGWSMVILVREFIELYKAYSLGIPNPFPALELQYVDYACWQREFLQGDVLNQEISYWQKQLAGAPSVHALPLDNERPLEMQHVGDFYLAEQNALVGAGIIALAKKQGVTPFMLVHAALSIMIARNANGHDVVIGTPVANRLRKELEPVMGFFLNDLTLRCHVDDEQSFADFLQAIKKINIEAQSHQNLPFDSLVDHLKVPRTTQFSPVFQILLNMNTNEQMALSLPNLTLSPAESRTVTAKFDLEISLQVSETGLTAEWVYDVALFNRDTIERYAAHLSHLLVGIIANPQSRIVDLPMMGEEERQYLLSTGNGSSQSSHNNPIHDRQNNSLIPHLVSARSSSTVNENTQEIALRCGDETMTYTALEAKTNQLAGYLCEQGVGVESLVGIGMHRSIDTVVAMLATLKAGAAFVPLDPTYPQSRLDYMMEDSGLKVVLTQLDLLPSFSRKSVHSIPVDHLDDILQKFSTEWQLPSDVSESSLAYVIYTSGSTGKPKGVMIEHRAAVNFIHSMLGALPQDIYQHPWMLLTSISFDISLFEWLGCLAIGNTCVIVDEEQHHDPLALAAYINTNKLSFIQTTPSRWLQLFDAGLKPDYAFVAASGGEALNSDLLKKFKSVKIEPYNCYGPTEATVWSSVNHVSRKLNQKYKLALGPGLGNYTHFVLDSEHRLLPKGSMGELYIGGDSLARGYFQRDDLTAERFVHVDLGDGQNRRLYRTGDLARVLSDGYIEFMGRADDQVKVRGYRIELGEIEQQLTGLPGIDASVVVAREAEGHDGGGQTHLVGYLEISDGVSGETTDLFNQIRIGLMRTLPDYMIPTAFVIIDRWPLTPNEKIDRNALPMPDSFASQREYIAPRNILEQQLVAIWADLLNVPLDQLSVTDNFFEIGGNSLLTVRLVTAIRSRMHYEVPVKDVFEFSTVELMAQFIEAQGEKIATKGGRPAIVRVERGAQSPLSFAQQRVWLFTQIEQDNAALYNMPVFMRVDGQFDLSAANKALAFIVARHEILRTVYGYNGADPVQMIRESVPTDIQVEDVSHLQDEAQAREVARLADTDAAKPFDLSRDAMLRATWLQLSLERGVLVFNVHHIASDAHSMEILIREFVDLYADFVADKEASLPPLPIQYIDFALWQRDYLQGDVLQQDLDYWSKQLEALPPAHSLPLDKPRPKENPYTGAFELFELEADTAQRFSEFANKHKVTDFMLLHAMLSVVIARNSRTKDVVIGTAVANRTDVAVEPLIGLFINSLVLRNNLENCRTFSEVLEQTKQVNLDAQSHQNIPFEQLVEHLNVERSTQHSPLFQIMLSIHKDQVEPMSIEGLDFEMFFTDSVQAKFDIQIDVVLYEKGMQLKWVYAPSIFEADTIKRFNNHLMQVIQQVLDNPDQALSEISLLSETENQYLLGTLNDTSAELGNITCLPVLFEQVAETQPDAVALVFGDRSMCYGELNARANQLAHYLRQEHKVGPETLVGLCAHRSFEMVIGILGILKAGGAYVPLDPDYPVARLVFMLQDADLSVVLYDQAAFAGEDENVGGAVVLEQQQFADYPDINLSDTDSGETGLSSEHLAYVIYTSGSTGQPKGVMVEHGALFNRIDWMQRKYRLRTGDKVLQKTPFTFDVSVWEFLWPLCYSGSLVLADPGGHKDPQYLSQVITEQEINILHFVPSMLRAYLTAVDKPFVDSVRHLICSGEALGREEVKTVLAKSPHVAVHNLYGPTEASIDVTAFDFNAFDGQFSQSEGSIPIGCAIQNTQLFVLGNDQELMPLGAVGELYIGGMGLARGYWNRPDLTNERFVVNPFYDVANPISSQLLYRTGDLVRYGSDGNLEFLGRADDQVKLRGFRIELEEIATQLEAVDLIHRAVVLVKGENDAGKLVAYVECTKDLVVEEQREQALQAAKSSLEKQLPKYMLPSAYVVIEQWPITARGKLDKDKLPEPDLAATTEFVAAASEIESELVGIWSELLSLPADKISVMANFFELGGQSLLAVRLMAAIREKLGKEVPIKAIFDNSHIRALAVLVEQASAAAVGQRLTTLERASGNQLPASYAQQRLWFIDKLQGNSAEYNLPLMLRVSGEFDIEVVKKALAVIVERHEILRTVYREAPDGVKQVVQPLAEVPFFEFKATEEDIPHRVAQEVTRPFDLGADVMIRITWLKLGDQEGVLILNMHHIASDGWSMGVLAKEFLALYQAYISGQVSPLPALTIQYADFAQWQRGYLRGEVLEKELAYWRKQLADIPSEHSLPLDHPRPAQSEHIGERLRSRLGADIRQQLDKVARDHHLTPFMFVHAVFARMISRHSNSTDIVIGTPVANRMDTVVEPLIGLFVNTLALRVDTAREDYFKHVREVHLGAQAHQQIQFEQLVEHLNVVRSISHSPVFQIMFSMDNNEAVALDLEGVEFNELNIDTVQAKFDIQLNLQLDAEGIDCNWVYDAAIFEASSINVLDRHFRCLLENMLVGNNQMLAEAEQNYLLKSLQHPSEQQQENRHISELFEQQVKVDPQALALVTEQGSLSFGELNNKANQVARYLQEVHRVGPGDTVGLLTESPGFGLISLLGILKSGGTYVPLDVKAKMATLKTIVERAKTKCVLADKTLAESVKVADLFPMDESIFADYSTENLPGESDPQGYFSPEHLACVFYRFDAGGQLDAAKLQHKAISQLAFALDKRALNQSSKVWGLTPSLQNEDVLYALGQLFIGKTLYLFNAKQCEDVDEVMAQVDAHNIDILSCSQGQMQQWLQNDAQPVLPDLAISGDLINPDLWSQIVSLQSQNDSQAYHLCGWGETLAQSSIGVIEGETPNIGQFLPGTFALIYSPDGDLAPLGALGELYVGDFIEADVEAFDSEVLRSTKLHKTGLLGRYLSDGSIEYVGYKTHMRYLRGFTVDLGKASRQLQGVAGVQRAEILIKEATQRLVAYLQLSDTLSSKEGPKENPQAVLQQVKEAAQANLPLFMQPDAYQIIEQWPENHEGGLDVEAMLDVDETLDEEVIAPTTETESSLVNIYSELLEKPPESISVTTSFFDLGGHSVLTIMLISAIRERLAKEIEINMIFDNPSVQAMARIVDKAEAIDVVEASTSEANMSGESPGEIGASEIDIPEKTGTDNWQPILPMNKAPENAARVYLVPGAGGLAVSMQPMATAIGQRAQMLVLDNRGFTDEQSLYTSMNEQVLDYVHAVHADQPQGKLYLVGHSLGGSIIFEMAVRLSQMGREVELVFLDSILFPANHSEIGIGLDRLGYLKVLWERIYHTPAPEELDESQLFERVRDQLVELGMMDAASADAKLNRFIDVYVQQIQWFGEYRPQAKFPGKVTLLHADDGAIIGEFKPMVFERIQASLESELITLEVTGDHYSMLTAPHSDMVADLICEQFGIGEG